MINQHRVGDRFVGAACMGHHKGKADGVAGRQRALPGNGVTAIVVGCAVRLGKPVGKGDIAGQRVGQERLIGIGVAVVGDHDGVRYRFAIFNSGRRTRYRDRQLGRIRRFVGAGINDVTLGTGCADNIKAGCVGAGQARVGRRRTRGKLEVAGCSGRTIGRYRGNKDWINILIVPIVDAKIALPVTAAARAFEQGVAILGRTSAGRPNVIAKIGIIVPNNEIGQGWATGVIV